MSDITLRQFKLIVFDWDGTLMDSVDRIVGCMQAASRDSGIYVPSTLEVKEIIGLGLQEALQQLFPDHDHAMHCELTKHYRRHFLHESTIPSQMFKGAFETLAALQKAGYILAIATGKARRGLDRVIEETKVAPFFSASRCADETQSKPHPQMLFELMKDTHVRPSETLMVGDSEFDLKMAKGAGTASLAVSYGVHDKSRLINHDPIGCIDDISEMVQLIPAC